MSVGLTPLRPSLWNANTRSSVSLTGLDVTKFNTSNVTNMDSMFEDCGNLAELDISGFDMSRVENREDMLTGTLWE